MEMAKKQCESCEVVGINTPATTTRNNESVCQECADEIDAREEEQQGLKEAYEQRDRE